MVTSALCISNGTIFRLSVYTTNDGYAIECVAGAGHEAQVALGDCMRRECDEAGKRRRRSARDR